MHRDLIKRHAPNKIAFNDLQLEKYVNFESELFKYKRLIPPYH